MGARLHATCPNLQVFKGRSSNATPWGGLGSDMRSSRLMPLYWCADACNTLMLVYGYGTAYQSTPCTAMCEPAHSLLWLLLWLRQVYRRVQSHIVPTQPIRTGQLNLRDAKLHTTQFIANEHISLKL